MSAQLELFFPRLLRETYVIHPTGGSHPFKHVKEASSIYHQDIWPYIERIHWPEKTERANEWRKTQRPQQMNLNISFQHVYPYISLMGNETYLKNQNGKVPRWTNKSIYIQMHAAVARALVPNVLNKPHVLHLNDDPADYRVENLKWGTNKENHTNRRKDRKLSMNTVHTIFKLNGWAQG